VEARGESVHHVKLLRSQHYPSFQADDELYVVKFANVGTPTVKPPQLAETMRHRASLYFVALLEMIDTALWLGTFLGLASAIRIMCFDDHTLCINTCLMIAGQLRHPYWFEFVLGAPLRLAADSVHTRDLRLSHDTALTRKFTALARHFRWNSLPMGSIGTASQALGGKRIEWWKSL
jgi:hypothetical protein